VAAHLLEGRVRSLMSGGVHHGFSIGTTHSIIKLKRYETTLDYGKPVRLRVADASGQARRSSSSPSTGRSKVKVAWTALAGPKGATIAKNDVSVDIVGYVKTTPPDYEVDYIGWWPDHCCRTSRLTCLFTTLSRSG